ncbi:MAG TPA: hypothetical protein PKE39_13350 [Ignavibacteria bacterium]|nr:hypothetical protein [Ignavibacteria bacterium]HMR00006.1 hypothetical protein [Ignavibacteria bacterium]
MEKLNSMKPVFRVMLVLLMSTFMISGCGKKEDSTSKSDDNKSDSKETTDKTSFSKDKPFMVEFEVTGKEKGNGTVSAIYDGKKCRSTSTFDADGKKFSATAYFDGGDIVYTVSDIAGVKMGMKFDKKKFSDTKDNVDVNSFRDYIDQMEKIGEEEIIGYKCEIYKHKEKNFTVSLYEKTVPLRMGSADGKTYMKATKFEKDVKVTDDMFKAPQDVKYMDMTNMLEDMKNMKDGGKNLQDLKDKTKEMEEIMKNYKK